MRALLQRVSRASVRVGDEPVGAIGPGIVALVGIARGDSEADARYLVEKTVNLRIFPDDEGRFDRSALDVGADLLLVSQFTLHADTRKGRRPSFVRAAPRSKRRPSSSASSKPPGAPALLFRQGGSRSTWLWRSTTTAL